MWVFLPKHSNRPTYRTDADSPVDMRLKNFLVLLTATVLLVHSAPAQDKKARPDFSGVWQLDADRSKDVLDVFKKKPKKGEPVTKITDTITIRHVDPALEFLEKVVIEKI